MLVSGEIQAQLDAAEKAARAAFEDLFQKVVALSPKGAEVHLRELASAADALFVATDEHQRKVASLNGSSEVLFENAAEALNSRLPVTRCEERLQQALAKVRESGAPRLAVVGLGDANRAMNEALLALGRLRQTFRIS